MIIKKVKTYILVSILSVSMLQAGNNSNSKELSEITPIKTPFYIGIGAGLGLVNSYTYSKEHIADIHIRTGYNWNKNLGIEVRAASGVNSGTYLEHSYTIGVYLKPQISLNDSDLYALLGYARTKIELDDNIAQANGVNSATIQNGLSFGIGVDYQINKHYSLYGEVIQYINENATIYGLKYSSRVNAVNMGVSYHF
jgi:hypothetical protein